MGHGERIEINLAICSGKPCIRLTRIPVASILSQVTAGESWESIRRGFPGLTDEDIQAAIEFGRQPTGPDKAPPNAP